MGFCISTTKNPANSSPKGTPKKSSGVVSTGLELGTNYGLPLGPDQLYSEKTEQFPYGCARLPGELGFDMKTAFGCNM